MNDYITSREETTAEYYLRWAVEKCGKKGYVKLPCDKVLEIADCIENIRNENRENVKGEWITANEQPYFRKHYNNVVCSVCHRKGDSRWYFCPNCGADMRGGNNGKSNEQ